MLVQQVKSLGRRFGVDVRRWSGGPIEIRQSVLKQYRVDTIVDVGANAGQYGTAVRSGGFVGSIISFEPVPDAFQTLKSVASADPTWDVHNVALGSGPGTIPFNVSSDSVCSSALTAAGSLTSAIPEARAVDEVDVRVVDLDSYHLSSAIHLKIDTQGYEDHVLNGSKNTLHHVKTLEVEMALVQLYEGGSSIYSLLPRLHQLGFVIHSVQNGFIDRTTRQTLDVDIMLVRGSVS